MAKQGKTNPGNKKNVGKPIKKPAAAPKEPYWGFEKYLEKNQSTIIFIFLLISFVLSFFIFNMRISEGGDDAGYIQAAWNFVHFNKFPFWQGPLYPLTLSPFVYFFGINLFILKSLSVVFALGHVWFTYLAFRKRVPYLILFSLIFFISSNNFFQYYSSQTYTESFFLFLQALTLYFLMKLVDSMPDGLSIKKEQKINIDDQSTKNINYKGFLLIGLLFFLLSLAKSVGIFCIIPVVLFFLCYKNLRYALYTFISFALWKGMYEFVIRLFYKNDSMGQLHDMLLKVSYSKTEEMEDFPGMLARFYSNFQQFASVSVLKILHLRNALAIQPDTFLAYVVAIILLATIAYSYKSNKYIFFSGIYFLVLSSGIFFGVQADNKQDRLMLVVMPFIFMVLMYGLYRLTFKSSALRFCFFLLLIIYLPTNLYKSIFEDKLHDGMDGAIKNFSSLKKNIAGDKYYGYTDDWANYLKMSAYCGDSLPATAFVATRKAPMSFIYANGKEFYNVPKAFSQDPDSILMYFKSNNVTHIIMPNLRSNPAFNNGQIISTIQRLLYPINQKYPQKLTLVKQIGESEPAYLYKFNY